MLAPANIHSEPLQRVRDNAMVKVPPHVGNGIVVKPAEVNDPMVRQVCWSEDEQAIGYNPNLHIWKSSALNPRTAVSVLSDQRPSALRLRVVCRSETWPVVP